MAIIPDLSARYGIYVLREQAHACLDRLEYLGRNGHRARYSLLDKQLRKRGNQTKKLDGYFREIVECSKEDRFHYGPIECNWSATKLPTDSWRPVLEPVLLFYEHSVITWCGIVMERAELSERESQIFFCLASESYNNFVELERRLLDS